MTSQAMTKIYQQRIGLLLALTILSTFFNGCSTLSNRQAGTFGATQIVENTTTDIIDLALELDPEGVASLDEGSSLDQQQKDLRASFKSYHTKYDDKAEITQKQKRNQVQERILIASDQRCGEYEKHLMALNARTNFLLGSITTALAGAGAIFTAADTVRALSGSASIFSGIRGEFNADYFADKSAQLITAGFKAKRKDFYKNEILINRNLSTTDYPIERAVKDAVIYHAHCSLNSGLEHAAASVQRSEDVGLTRLLKAQSLAQNISFNASSNPQAIGVIKSGARKKIKTAKLAISDATPKQMNDFLVEVNNRVESIPVLGESDVEKNKKAAKSLLDRLGIELDDANKLFISITKIDDIKKASEKFIEQSNDGIN